MRWLKRGHLGVSRFSTILLCWPISRILACHAGGLGSIPWPFGGFSFFDHSSLLTLKQQLGGSWWFLILGHSSLYVARIGGSVVEFSPATREARVRFPANAAGSPFVLSSTQPRAEER